MQSQRTLFDVQAEQVHEHQHFVIEGVCLIGFDQRSRVDVERGRFEERGKSVARLSDVEVNDRHMVKIVYDWS